ncbi:hypothetical protein ABZ606_26220 [Streptomyces sp. NPDC012461]
MSGRADSDTPPDTRPEPDEAPRDPAGPDAPSPAPDEDPGPDGSRARRARFVAAGTGAVLSVAGLAAALLRLAGPAPAPVPAAYAGGAAVCVLAAVLGSRGRTRRALWLLIAGLMVMALGDQFD